jgi:hypothetical protein
MTDRHAFADESIRGENYLLAVTTVPAAQSSNIRKAIKELLLPGQRRIHFAEESDKRRRQILSGFAEIEGTTTTIYWTTSQDQRAARQSLIVVAVPDLRDHDAKRFILDSRDGQDAQDRATIGKAVGTRPEPEFTYSHQRSAIEPLLWIPDALAWAWGRGGNWRRLVEDLGLISRVQPVGVR